jgi:hypothetical protein
MVMRGHKLLQASFVERCWIECNYSLHIFLVITDQFIFKLVDHK